ncbi:family 78 glycoside hydrolase catalytic domain [Microbacterium murale]|uniref:alpha-L-rhamnosidase n=1 Tax=Microbacterium murale TaxID=1081040 RepID=A0ABU0P5N8_9MICO|nr:family 78 glycoside hydrolase catalytic domain [Microbacterium murale]MDQ0642644.1 alpha-L-rhamnosidase [Microbacterium murale]
MSQWLEESADASPQARESPVGQSVAVTRLRAEYQDDAFGIATATPRLSWRIEGAGTEWHSDRYELTLERSSGVDSVIVHSPEQLFVPWPFAPLESRERVRLRVRSGSGFDWSAPSAPLIIEAGLLEQNDWVRDLISPSTIGGLTDGAPLLFGEADLAATPVTARLYLTAHGIVEFTINGRRVGDDIFAPGWTAYEKRLRYRTYDITEHLQAGPNRLQALLGNGWYRGQLVWPENRSSYGDRLALLAQIEVTYADGSLETFGTDASWGAVSSSILFDDFYDGQRRDMRIADSPEGKAIDTVDVQRGAFHRLVAPSGPPVRVTETLPAVELITSPSGRTIVDFGQNLVGWVRLRVSGAAGDEVTVRHAEVLEHGELGVRPLRSALATSAYILSGRPDEVLQPTLTFNGFRYAEIVGVPELSLADVEALVLGTDLERTGWFESSDARLNRLHENVLWSTRGNFLAVPTDCPQRDERLGWTGDIQVFAPTATTLFDTAGFLSEWLEDLAAEQKSDGGVPFVVPDVLRDPDPAAAAWSDAATIVPEALHLAYGDVGVLERQYASMRAWVEKVRSMVGDDLLWTSGGPFGDWLDPTAPPEDAAQAQADPDVVATAYFARSSGILARAAALLGRHADAEDYADLALRVRAAFVSAYVSDTGVVHSDCQTVYALAITGDLFETDHQRDGAGRRLAELVSDAEYRVSTGFVGTPLILDALSKAGREDLAHRMLLTEACPSWLYAVSMGATTVWERWDSMLPDGSINPGTMTSFNHYAYGAVADWMHRCVAGLAPTSPGYRTIEVRPLVTGDLSSASARHLSPYGEIAVSWRLENGSTKLSLSVPYGVTAEVWMPGASAPTTVDHGHHEFGSTSSTP